MNLQTKNYFELMMLCFGVLCRYVMDELGSALRHSDEPNFRVAPFLFMPEGTLASAVRLSLCLSSFTFPFLKSLIFLIFCR